MSCVYFCLVSIVAITERTYVCTNSSFLHTAFAKVYTIRNIFNGNNEWFVPTDSQIGTEALSATLSMVSSTENSNQQLKLGTEHTSTVRRKVSKQISRSFLLRQSQFLYPTTTESRSYCIPVLGRACPIIRPLFTPLLTVCLPYLYTTYTCLTIYLYYYIFLQKG